MMWGLKKPEIQSDMKLTSEKSHEPWGHWLRRMWGDYVLPSLMLAMAIFMLSYGLSQ